MADTHSRRDLFRNLFGALRPATATGPDSDAALRPPGALVPDEAFLDACTGCGECVPVCPAACIEMLEVEPDRRAGCARR